MEEEPPIFILTDSLKSLLEFTLKGLLQLGIYSITLKIAWFNELRYIPFQCIWIYLPLGIFLSLMIRQSKDFSFYTCG